MSEDKKPETRPEAKPKPAQPEAAAPALAEKKERFVAASESRFATSVEFSFPLTSYIPESGTPLAHVLRPAYWASIPHTKLKAGCRIWVYPEDETWWAELLVRKVGQGYAKVQLLRQGELEALSPADPELAKDYDIEFRGAVIKHRVVRKKDGVVVKQGLDSEAEAQAWLRDHRRMLAA